MTNKRTAKASRSSSRPKVVAIRHVIESSSTKWTDSSGGEWDLTAHWSVIDGRATLVGLDIRSFWGSGSSAGPIGERLQELTQRVFRAIPVGTIRENTRAAIAEEMQLALPGLRESMQLHPAGVEPETADLVAQHFAKRAAAFTAAGRPRKRTPTAGPEVLEEVARLYLRTVMAGDKTPAKTVEAQLRAAGWPVSERGGRDQVRKWIQRARERKLIPPVGREVETLNRIPT